MEHHTYNMEGVTFLVLFFVFVLLTSAKAKKQEKNTAPLTRNICPDVSRACTDSHLPLKTNQKKKKKKSSQRFGDVTVWFNESTDIKKALG